MALIATSLRMSHDLKRLSDEQAARLGMTRAEYHRAAVLAFTAWHTAMDAVEEHHGVDVDDLRDPVVIIRLLAGKH